MHMANGKEETAAVSLINGSSRVVYHAWPGFLAKYVHIFPLGSQHHWDQKGELYAWLESMLLSLLRSTIP